MHTQSPALRELSGDRETIVRLLYSIASKNEVERYLRIFSTANKLSLIHI